MARIIKRGTNRYLVKVFLGRDGSGKRSYHAKTIRGTKKQAEAYGTRIQHAFDTGTFREDAVETVGDFLTRWLDETAKRRVRPRTYEGYKEIIEIHLRPVVGRVRLSELTHEHVHKLVVRMEEDGKAPGTIRNSVGVLRRDDQGGPPEAHPGESR